MYSALCPQLGINPQNWVTLQIMMHPHLGVMDTGISILIYITYAYLYCLQLLLVTLDSTFIGSDRFMIIE